jgi:hypothetical protein
MQISTPTEAPYTEGAAAFGSVITYAGDVWVTTSASGVELVDRRHIRAFIAEEDGAFTPVEFGAVQNGASVEGGVDGTYSIVPTADGKSVKISGPWKAGFVQFGDNALGAVAATFVDLVFPLDGSCQGPIAGKLVVSVELVDEVMEARYTGCNTFDFVHIEGGIDAEPPVPTADPSIFAQAVTGIRGFAAAGMNALPAPFAPFAGEATDSADWCALHMAGNATPVVVTGPAVDAALDALPTTAPVLECLSFVLSPASTAITRVTDVVATLSVVTGSLDSTENLRLIGAMYGVQAVTGETGTGAFLTFAPLASADPASHPTLAALEDAAAAYAADPVANSSPFRNCLGTVSSDAPYCTPNSTITLGLNPSRLGLWLAPAGGEPVLFSRIVGLD